MLISVLKCLHLTVTHYMKLDVEFSTLYWCPKKVFFFFCSISDFKFVSWVVSLTNLFVYYYRNEFFFCIMYFCNFHG